MTPVSRLEADVGGASTEVVKGEHQIMITIHGDSGVSTPDYH